MLSNHGFDLWAGSYDKSVRMADYNNEYPFAGYFALMNAVYGTVMAKAPAKVLDAGVGTAVLAQKLYDGGCEITGIDFSAEMLETARRKMPDARLLQCDFTRGLPPELMAERFDFIISTYALHHLEGDNQTAFILQLLALLKPNGTMLIGDVCFPTEDALLECREQSGDHWDDEENYIVFSALKDALPGYSASFQAFSFCGGVIEIGRDCE